MDHVKEDLESEQQVDSRRRAVEQVRYAGHDATFERPVPVETSLAILRRRLVFLYRLLYSNTHSKYQN